MRLQWIARAWTTIQRFRHGTLVALVAVLALAAAPLAGAVKSPPPPPNPDNPYADDQVVPREMMRQFRLREARDAERKTDEAKEARRLSRTKYRGKSRREALEIARAKFERILAAPAWAGVTLRGGERVKQYLGDTQALIQHSDDPEDVSLVESTLPLLTEADEPTDLELEPHGEGFAPKAPAIELSIPDDLSEGVALAGGQVRVTPQTDAPTEAEPVEDKVFFGNAQTDTDVLVVPTARGFETFHQLRSAESPEAVSFEVAVPGGATLRRSEADGMPPEARGIDVISPGGKRIATIGAPKAQDADGEPVAVDYAIDGMRVTMNVPHRDKDLAYPIMVDPEWISEEWFHWHSGNRDTYGWRYGQWGGCSNWKGWFGGGWWTYGHILWGQTNYQSCGGDEWAEWNWQSPRMSYIWRAEFHYQNHPFRQDCIVNALWGPWSNNWDGYVWLHCGDLWNHAHGHCPVHNNCDINNGQPSNAAIWKVQNGWWGGWREYGPWAELGGAAVYVRDRDNPVIDATGHNTDGRWYRSGTMTVAPRAHDDGLGMNKFQLYIPNFIDDYRRHPCVRSRCPGSWSLPNDGQGIFSYNLASLPNGINSVTLNARDVLDKITGSNWSVNVDDEQPWLNVYGDLRNAVYAGTWSGAKTMWINSQDNHNSPYNGTGATARSGITAVDVYVDGSKVHSQTQSCFANCRMDFSWTFHSDRYAKGNHTIRVVARDGAGNEFSSSTWTVSTTPSAPGSDTERSDPTDTGDFPDFADTPSDPVDYECTADPETGVTPYCAQTDTTNPAVNEAKAEASLAPPDPIFGLPKIQPGSDKGWGWADQNVDTLSRPSWQALNIKRLRVQVPWDALLLSEQDVTYKFNARLMSAPNGPVRLGETWTEPRTSHYLTLYTELFKKIKEKIDNGTLKEVTISIYTTEIDIDQDEAFNKRGYWWDNSNGKPMPDAYKLGSRVLPPPGDKPAAGQPGEWEKPLDGTGQCDRTTYICNVRRLMRWIRTQIKVNDGDAAERPGVPNVKYIASFNEPNHPSYAPSGRNSYPELNTNPSTTNQDQLKMGAYMGARYQNVLSKWCGSQKAADEGGKCVAVAGDFVDRDELVKKIQRTRSDGSKYWDYTYSYLYWYQRKLTEKVPIVWGYHAYGAARTRSYGTLKEFNLRTTPRDTSKKSQIWLTEQGPTYSGTNGNWKRCLQYPGENSPERRTCQWNEGAESTRFLVKTVPERFPRITRFYYYALRGGLKRRPIQNPPTPQDDTAIIEASQLHDSGMIDPDLEQRPPAGTTMADWLRPAWCVYGYMTNPSAFPTVRNEAAGTRDCAAVARP